MRDVIQREEQGFLSLIEEPTIVKEEETKVMETTYHRGALRKNYFKLKINNIEKFQVTYQGQKCELICEL